MSDPIVDRERLAELIGRLLDDQATPDEIDTLESALRENAEFRKIYRSELQTHALLAFPRHWQPPSQAIIGAFHAREGFDELGGGDARSESALSAKRSSCPSSTSLILLAAAACLLVAVGVLSQAWHRDIAGYHGESPRLNTNGTASLNDLLQPSIGLVISTPATNVARSYESVARIGETISARWENAPQSNSTSWSAGASLQPGWLRLRSGVVRVDFLSGARMVLQGPAELEIRSPWEAYLKSGSASCRVAEWARGFRLIANGMDVLDMGAEFGVSVDEPGAPEVHVFDGKVAVSNRSSSKPVELVAKEALTSMNGSLQIAKFSAESFTKMDEFSRRAEQSKVRRMTQWKLAADKISRDPATLVHYTFSDYQRDDLQIPNQATEAPSGSNALVIGCRESEGRWPNKKAIEFHGRGDRLLLSDAGSHKQLTGIMWIRVDNLTQPLTGLLMSEAPKRRLEQQSMLWETPLTDAMSQAFDAAPIKMIRWEISNTSDLLFNTYQGPTNVDRESWSTVSTLPLVTPDTFGQWIQVAIVYNADDQSIQQYFNGKLVSRSVTEASDPLFLGHLAVGNLSRNAEEEALPKTSREFIGAIDELLISSRAYSDEEIRTNWNIGKP